MQTNTLDLLLASDLSLITRPSKQVEIPRLSKLFGQPVIFTCEALSPDEYADCQKKGMRLSKNGEFEDIDITEAQVWTVLKGVKEPDFKNKDLREKFNAPTPKELVKNLLLSGEINQIYDVINELSGYGKDSVNEIKN